MTVEKDLAQDVIDKLNAAATTNKTKVVAFCIAGIAIFFLGAFVGVKYFAPALTQHHYTEKTIVEKPTIVKGEVNTVTDTQIVYVPKETAKYIDPATGKEITAQELTDIEANIGKQQILVSLNGKPLAVQKSEDEKFLFEKNKIALNQTSTITFNATVTPTVIDKTNRWALGVGFGNNGIGGKLDFPIGKHDDVGGWVYGDKNTGTGGVQFKF